MKAAEIKNSPAMLTVIHRIVNEMPEMDDYAGWCENVTDSKLATLVYLAGQIVNTTNPTSRAAAVHTLACGTWAWLESLHLSETDIAQRIAAERIRQRELFAQRRHHFRVDDFKTCWTRKFRVLIEEVGEVAQAIDQWEASPRCKKYRAHFITELIQVAAVCVAWLESFEPEN